MPNDRFPSQTGNSALNPTARKRAAAAKQAAARPAQKDGAKPVNKPAGKVVVVKAGDTLTSIAKKSGTSVASIKRLNPKFTQVAKYQGGNKIFRGTTVKVK